MNTWHFGPIICIVDTVSSRTCSWSCIHSCMSYAEMRGLLGSKMQTKVFSRSSIVHCALVFFLLLVYKVNTDSLHLQLTHSTTWTPMWTFAHCSVQTRLSPTTSSSWMESNLCNLFPKSILSSRVNAHCYLWLRQTTTLSQHPPAEAELASQTPRKMNDL
jgi:hypothetical protein